MISQPPIVRLFGVPTASLHEVSRSGRGLKAGERLVIGIDPNALAERSEAKLLRDLHTVIKTLRAVWEVRARPRAEALEAYRLKQQGKTYREIADHFASAWRDCTDIESRERRAKRYVKQVRSFLARASEREQASLTPRQRAILESYERLKTIEPKDKVTTDS